MFSFPGLGKVVAWSWALKAFGALSLISALNAGRNQAFRLVTKVGKDQSAGMDSIVYRWVMTWLSKDTSTRTDDVKPEFSKWEPWSQHFLKNKQLRMCACYGLRKASLERWGWPWNVQWLRLCWTCVCLHLFCHYLGEFLPSMFSVACFSWDAPTCLLIILRSAVSNRLMNWHRFTVTFMLNMRDVRFKGSEDKVGGRDSCLTLIPSLSSIVITYSLSPASLSLIMCTQTSWCLV